MTVHKVFSYKIIKPAIFVQVQSCSSSSYTNPTAVHNLMDSLSECVDDKAQPEIQNSSSDSWLLEVLKVSAVHIQWMHYQKIYLGTL